MASENEISLITDEMENGLSVKDTVVLTGFGPFSVHKSNPSWEVVQHLKATGIGKDVNLVVKQIPVEYDYVKSEVQNLWNKYNPKLVVHCGVSGVARDLTLEQTAHNSGYHSKDNKGSLPSNNCCVHGAPDTLKSAIEMKKVCEDVNNSSCSVKAVVSNDPGRYLCDFIYFTSLSIDHHRTAFIHVPVLDKPYSSAEIAEALRVAIVAMLNQSSENPCMRDNEVAS